jgi:2-polyprenyl-3-methyl-5-hydroxy-6-metoxy-1,4-benzoquinol methylase
MMIQAGDVVARAIDTGGESADPIYTASALALRERRACGVFVDVGCGVGRFLDAARDLVSAYIGVDVVRHERLPAEVTFVQADLDRERVPLPDQCADVVSALETIEHLENPRAFCRELVRLLRPGGWLLVTTPNQLSALSLLCLVFRGQFAAFQQASYPAHRTALLECDLRRIAEECGLERREIVYTCTGRIPLTRFHYPGLVARMFPRAFSDNLLLVAQKHA